MRATNEVSLIRRREAARRLGVSPRTLRRLIDAGLIREVRLPGPRTKPLLRIPEEEIRKYRTQGPRSGQ